MDSHYDAIVRDYNRRIKPKVQKEFDWFKNQPNITAAIDRAAMARDREGKRYSHQRRIKKLALSRARQALSDNAIRIQSANDFDELHDLIKQITLPIEGIGELYVYDTAFRLGIYIDKLPTKVYLHSGTRRGAAALGFNATESSLEISVFSPQFQQLAPYEIEDVLCIYKDKFMNPSDVIDAETLKPGSCN